MTTFSQKKKIIETITYWIDYSPLATRVMDYIKFNNFFINFFFNYMIKIYAHKIKYQSKNRYLFETVITL
jgi:hypothetical protein